MSIDSRQQRDPLSGVSGHGRLSPRQLRAVRKELLVARASLDRMTIVEAQRDLARGMSRLGWLGLLMPGFRRRADVGDGASFLSALPSFLRPVVQVLLPALRRHPLSAALMSLLLGVSNGNTMRKAGGSAKWAGAALLGVKAFGFWRRFRDYRAQRAERRQARTR